jgi:DNA-binding MarR family transcriptional regulator
MLISKSNYMTQAAKTDPRSLEETAARLRLVINRAARRMRQEAGTELRPSRASALVTAELHGPLTPSELAEIEGVKRPTATRILRGLEAEGLIERTPDPNDGRSALISITGEGRERLRRLRRRKNAYLARRMRDLDVDDVESLERAAEILELMLEGDRARRPEGSA